MHVECEPTLSLRLDQEGQDIEVNTSIIKMYGGGPTVGGYPADGSYGGAHEDNHNLPGGVGSPIDDQVPSYSSSARAPPAGFVDCAKQLISKVRDDEKQADTEGLEALSINQQAEMFEVLVPNMGTTFRLRHSFPQQSLGRAQMWGTAVSQNEGIISIMEAVIAQCGVVGKLTVAELIGLTRQTVTEFSNMDTTSHLERSTSQHLTFPGYGRGGPTSPPPFTSRGVSPGRATAGGFSPGGNPTAGRMPSPLGGAASPPPPHSSTSPPPRYRSPSPTSFSHPTSPSHIHSHPTTTTTWPSAAIDTTMTFSPESLMGLGAPPATYESVYIHAGFVTILVPAAQPNGPMATLKGMLQSSNNSVPREFIMNVELLLKELASRKRGFSRIETQSPVLTAVIPTILQLCGKLYHDGQAAFERHIAAVTDTQNFDSGVRRMTSQEALEIGKAILKNKFAEIVREKLYLFTNLETTAKAGTTTEKMSTEEVTQALRGAGAFMQGMKDKQVGNVGTAMARLVTEMTSRNTDAKAFAAGGHHGAAAIIEEIILPTITDYEEQREHRMERPLAIDNSSKFPEPLANMLSITNMENNSRSRVRGYILTLDALKNLHAAGRGTEAMSKIAEVKPFGPSPLGKQRDTKAKESKRRLKPGETKRQGVCYAFQNNECNLKESECRFTHTTKEQRTSRRERRQSTSRSRSRSRGRSRDRRRSHSPRRGRSRSRSRDRSRRSRSPSRDRGNSTNGSPKKKPSMQTVQKEWEKLSDKLKKKPACLWNTLGNCNWDYCPFKRANDHDKSTINEKDLMNFLEQGHVQAAVAPHWRNIKVTIKAKDKYIKALKL